MNQTKPLEGITIVDFTRLLPGPLGTHLMSQLGAKVIKIESPNRLDYTRFYQPKIDNESLLYHSLNYSKEQVTIDYESDEGYHNICEIIKESDILVEQFRPGAMASFNLDFEKVKQINPAIVYVSVTGYGQDGPLCDKAGHDLNYLALAGLLDLNRDESGKPVIPGFQIADVAGGSYMMMAACTSGLLAQKLQNKAQYIDLSLVDSIIPMSVIPQSMSQGGISYKDMPILSGMLVNYNVYQCKDKKWIALGALEPKFWNVFCEMVNKPKWKNKKEHELIKGFFPKEELEELFKNKTQHEWMLLSKKYDACLSPVVKIDDVISNPHIEKREIFTKTKINNTKIHTISKPFKTYS